MLASIDFGTPVSVILDNKANSLYPQPVTAAADTNWAILLELMHRYVIRHIPLLDSSGHVVDLALMEDFTPSGVLPMQAIVLAGGESKRLHPLAADLPKPMLPVGNRPLLEYTITQLREAGLTR